MIRVTTCYVICLDGLTTWTRLYALHLAKRQGITLRAKVRTSTRKIPLKGTLEFNAFRWSEITVEISQQVNRPVPPSLSVMNQHLNRILHLYYWQMRRLCRNRRLNRYIRTCSRGRHCDMRQLFLLHEFEKFDRESSYWAPILGPRCQQEDTRLSTCPISHFHHSWEKANKFIFHKIAV